MKQEIDLFKQHINAKETKTFSLKPLWTFKDDFYEIEIIEKKKPKENLPDNIVEPFFKIITKHTGTIRYFNKEDVLLIEKEIIEFGQKKQKKEAIITNLQFNEDFFAEHNQLKSKNLINFFKIIRKTMQVFKRKARVEHSCNGVEIENPSENVIEISKQLFGPYAQIINYEDKHNEKKTKLVILTRINENGYDLNSFNYAVTMLGTYTFALGAIASAPTIIMSSVPIYSIATVSSVNLIKSFLFGAGTMAVGASIARINELTAKIADKRNGCEKDKILTILNKIEENSFEFKSHYAVKKQPFKKEIIL